MHSGGGLPRRLAGWAWRLARNAVVQAAQCCVVLLPD